MQTIERVRTALYVIGTLALLGGCLAFGWAFQIWRY